MTCIIQNLVAQVPDSLTLILLELIVISLCHQYRARPACTSMRYDQALYCWLILISTLYCYIDIPKNDNGQFQKREGGQVHLRNSAG